MSALSLSKICVTRLCHDLAGAVGAVSNSLELLSEDGGADAETLQLAESGAGILVARLSFFRAAYGNEGPLSGEEAARQLTENYLRSMENSVVRFTCEWDVDSEMPLFAFRLMLLAVQSAAESLVRGGRLKIEAKAGEKRLHICGEGRKVLLDTETADVLAGRRAEASPKQAGALFLMSVLQEQGWRLDFTRDETGIDFVLSAKE